MATSFGAGLLFLLLPGAHFLLSWPAYFFLTAITRFVEYFGSLSWVSIEITSPPLFLLLVWYALLIGSFVFLEKRYEKKWYAEAFSFPRRR